MVVSYLSMRTRSAAALIALVVLVGCSSPKRDAAPVNVEVTVGPTSVANVGDPIEISQDQRAAVTRALTTYVRSATADPLSRGQLGGDLELVFDAGALAAATGPDRAALLDEGLPTGKTTITPITTTLNALGGSDNRLAVIAATLAVDASTETKQGPVTVTRNAMFAFTPDGNTWKVNAYDVTVTRDVGGKTSTSAGQR
jgi:hypothetical protein